MTTYCNSCSSDMDDDNESYKGACPVCGEFPDCGESDEQYERRAAMRKRHTRENNDIEKEIQELDEQQQGETVEDRSSTSCPECGRPMMVYTPSFRGLDIQVCSGLLDPVNPCKVIRQPVMYDPVICQICGREMIPVAAEDGSEYSYWICSGHSDKKDPCRETYRYMSVINCERYLCPECGRDLQLVHRCDKGDDILRCSGYGMARKPCSYSRDIPEGFINWTGGNPHQQSGTNNNVSCETFTDLQLPECLR